MKCLVIKGLVFEEQNTCLFYRLVKRQIAGLHDHNKSGFFGGPGFIQPNTAI